MMTTRAEVVDVWCGPAQNTPHSNELLVVLLVKSHTLIAMGRTAIVQLQAT